MKVNLQGTWTKYLSVPPAGAEVLGVVNDDGDVGALIRYTATGYYVMAQGDLIISLDQAKVTTALRPPSADNSCGRLSAPARPAETQWHEERAPPSVTSNRKLTSRLLD